MGGLVLVALVGFGLWLAVVLWPLQKIAEWMEAGRTSYGACFLALLLAFVAGVAASLLLVRESPGLAAVVVIVVQLFVFSTVLQTSMVRGFVISLLSSLVSAVIGLIVVLVLSLFTGGIGALLAPAGSGDVFGGKEPVDPGTLAAPVIPTAPTSVSPTPVSPTPVSPTPVSPTRATPFKPTEEKTEASENRPPPPPTTNRRVRYSWVPIEKEAIRVHEGASVNLKTDDGVKHRGTIVSSTPTETIIRKRLSGGTIEFSIPTRMIVTAEVRTQVVR